MEAPKDKPLVSVLICAYNAQEFIKETLHSVLNQTYKNIEVLVLDNASTDKTLVNLRGSQGLRDPRLTVISVPHNLGSYAGLNFLLDKAKGSYIAINDHDDIWHPSKIEKQIDFLESNSEYMGCGTAIINWYEKYNAFQYRRQKEVARVAWHTSLVFRNSNYRYNTSVKVGTDFHFIRNILCKGGRNVYNFQAPMVLRRIFSSGKNLSGEWMKQMSVGEILGLEIGLIDKLALVNRIFMPKSYVEWVAAKCFSNNTPKKYESYAKTLSSTLPSRRS